MLLAGSRVLAGETYYADPVKGDPANNGSSRAPWKTLAEVVTSGKIKTLKPGDTLLLRSGLHGEVVLSGENAGMITIAAAKDEKPQLARLEIAKGSKWTIKGLTISPSFGAKYGKYMVSLAENGASDNLVLEDCFIYSALDSSDWSKKDWMNANWGVSMGRSGTHIILRNNYILNVRMGIVMASTDSLCEGNVVSDFSGDGIRDTADNQTIQYNVVKNCYVSMEDGDPNHDDAIQCFPYKDKEGLNKAVIRGNVLINQENPSQKFPGQPHGIGIFNFPASDFIIEDNVCLVKSWHGITLVNGRESRVTGNACFSIWKDSERKPLIRVGKNKNSGNIIVENNIAPGFELSEDKQLKAKNNELASAEAFEKALKKALGIIYEKYGKIHQLAGRKRLEDIIIK